MLDLVAGRHTPIKIRKNLFCCNVYFIFLSWEGEVSNVKHVTHDIKQRFDGAGIAKFV